MFAKNTKGPWWEIKLDAPASEDILAIPGLKATDTRVHGYVDSVAAAAKRLSVPVPQIPLNVTLSLDASSLREYQAIGVCKLVQTLRQNGGALLADDMGLGKTRQAFMVTKALMAKRTLIVCPAFVRESWKAEISRLGDACAVLRPAPTKKEQAEWAKSTTAPYVVTSYELAPRAFEHAFKDRSPDVLILDEGHMLKGRDTKRTKALQEIAALTTYKLMFTGTPIWDRPRDLYATLRLLLGPRFGSRTEFDVRYCNGRVGTYGEWVNDGATETDELRLRLSYYMVRRERKDVLHELPDLTRQVVWCDPDKHAQQAFLRAMTTRSPQTLADALSATLEAKIQPAIELAAEAKQFLLFTWMKSHAHQMAKVLSEERDTPCVCITGDLPTDKRSSLIAQAKANGMGVVATIDSAGAGVDGLQGVAHVGIMHALSWEPMKLAQGEARLHRMGQTKGVIWKYLACRESMDAVVVKTVVDKLDTFRAIMGGDSNRGLRDTLNAEEQDEKAALKALYDALDEGDV